jgi:hypothetical protein
LILTGIYLFDKQRLRITREKKEERGKKREKSEVRSRKEEQNTNLLLLANPYPSLYIHA